MKLLTRFNTLLAGALLAMAASAETPFNGLILDSNLEPVKKVKVYVDAKKYTKTDGKGRFGLTDVNPTDTLTVEVNKKKTIKVPVDGAKGIKIILDGEQQMRSTPDDEAANSGYGWVKRREYTGVSTGISGERLRATGQRNLLEALAGQVAGLTVTRVNGEVVAQIRGARSLMLSNAPLYILDGVEVESLDFVNVNDVDHVEVLKDASIYGSRGANGAIVVTTQLGALTNKK